MKGGPVAVLDLGSSKIVCFVAQRDEEGNFKVLGIGHKISSGIKSGVITDIKAAEEAITSTVHSAEQMAGETVESVMVNVSGSSLQSHSLAVEMSISGHQVTERDIAHIINEGLEHYTREEWEILHCIPIDYHIDDTAGIKDPRGMFGDKLSTNLHVVTASTTALRNLVQCLAACRLNISDFIVSSYASAFACLTEDEKNLGAIVIDIGGANTSISAFSGGNLVYVATLPYGGHHVTRDIALGLSTGIAHAERIKNLYGSAILTSVDKKQMIEVLHSDEEEEEIATASSHVSLAVKQKETMQVTRFELNSIIRPRVEEILELAKKNLDDSQYDVLGGLRVVLTGGSSQLLGIREVASEVFGRYVRLGKPMMAEGLAESTKGPAFSTAIGMLKYATEKEKIISSGLAVQSLGLNTDLGEHIPAKNKLLKAVKWLKKNF